MGHFVERYGPRISGMVAASFWGAGLMVASLGVKLGIIQVLWLGYGVLGGIGLGIGYITPVSTLVKWFPDRRGLATGLAIMGFGFLMVATLIERGLMAAFLSLLPVLLFGLGLLEPLLWAVSSGTFVIYGIWMVYRAIRNRKYIINTIMSMSLYFGLIGVGIAVIIVQLMHALGVGMQQSAWWYMIGVTWLLVTAGYRFFFILREWIHGQ